jgi:hypothetical protein
MPVVVRCTPDYLMRVMFRRLVALNVLPGGQIVGGSLQAMSPQTEEPLQISIFPINLPIDPLHKLDKYGTIYEGVFHIYYRHRNFDDPAWTDDNWLNNPAAATIPGYYAVLHASFLALSSWWPTGDLADDKAGQFLTTKPIECRTWNEVRRRKFRDRSMGEGMFEIRPRFVFDQDQLQPTH